MNKYIPVKNVLREIKKKSVRIWIDRLSYVHILLIWTIIIVSFGVMYYFFQNNFSYLFYNIKNAAVNDIRDAVYFSFVTATTTGFGDITPYGFFKVIAIVEVVFGLLLLALVTSKLVSIKQDIILSELYELSLNEKMSRLRASLLLFRQNLDRVVNKVEEGTIRRREINNIYTFLSSLEDIINQIITLITRPASNRYIKSIDSVDAELVLNSIVQSFEKVFELISILNEQKPDWKSEITVKFIKECIRLNDDLFENHNIIKHLSKAAVDDLNSRKADVINRINIELSKKWEETVKASLENQDKKIP